MLYIAKPDIGALAKLINMARGGLSAVVTLLRKFRDTCKIEDETKSARLEDF